ncbi:MAG: M20/M25/M40 family metallo-hydrolase [Gemmatimonadota bacterium]|nr:M20/M25/M40 family metallo-hydrolase [Gemmatimonadota bacterium]
MRADLPPSDRDHATLLRQLAPALARLAAADESLLTTQIAVSEIAAPTGGEQARGAFVANRFRTLGLDDVHVDDAGNVLGTRRGAETEGCIVICAHLDTIFPHGTAVAVTREGQRLSGPGIVDNSRGVAAMLALAESIDGRQVRTQRPIVFAATVGEEGEGDLRGAKHLFSTIHRPVDACIALDGAGDDRIVNRALGSRRFHVVFRGDGGHSWSSFGIANPVHAAGAAASKLASLPLPRSPRTTLSVCRIGGGLSVNAIPAEAWIDIDLRSTSMSVLDACVRDIHEVMRAAVREENYRRAPATPPLEYEISTIGDRPSGATEDDHPLVRAAMQATVGIGRRPELATASTDANVPISLGIPSIAIGAGGRGGGIHTSAEWYDNTEGHHGVARALMVLVGAAGLAGAD